MATAAVVLARTRFPAEANAAFHTTLDAVPASLVPSARLQRPQKHHRTVLVLECDAGGTLTLHRLARVDVMRMARESVGPFGGPSGADARADVVHARDLRKLDFGFSLSVKPAVMVRDRCVLAALGGIRGLVLRDRSLVFIPNGRIAARACRSSWPWAVATAVAVVVVTPRGLLSLVRAHHGSFAPAACSGAARWRSSSCYFCSCERDGGGGYSVATATFGGGGIVVQLVAVLLPFLLAIQLRMCVVVQLEVH